MEKFINFPAAVQLNGRASFVVSARRLACRPPPYPTVMDGRVPVPDNHRNAGTQARPTQHLGNLLLEFNVGDPVL
ncbi:hypothetical protein F7725_006891 [Dissostichus mawsoni]|uniref:Uncharacterized protein n=1 Tax=Dissostichus mawsoni TaxID=36200 RepID=A0A7J5XWX0_DISMA|nr:hypothetical protein F7725_006891 [Dissostichus mawsoni]